MQPDPKAENAPVARPCRKTLRWLIIVLVPLAAITALVHWTYSLAEPEYKGVKLSVWLDRLNNEVDADPERKEAVEAIQQIGSNAVPTLIKWLGASDSKLKLKLRELAEKQSIINFKFVDDREYHMRARSVFLMLGSKATSAIPDLEKLLHRPAIADQAAESLCIIGQNALPALMRGLNDRNPKVREAIANEIVLSMGPLASEPEQSEIMLPGPLVLTFMHDTEPVVRLLAVRQLAEAPSRRSVQPDLAVPALLTAVNDEDRSVRFAALIALRKIDPEAAKKATVK